MDPSGSPIAPAWLITPAGGPYAGSGLVGVLGGGPPQQAFSRALLGKLLDGPDGPAAALVLGTHPGTCAVARTACGASRKSGEYLEVNLTNRSLRWNPFDTPHVPRVEKAELLATVVNSFYGRGVEPFWHQLYSGALRWSMEALDYTGRPQYSAQDIRALFENADVLESLLKDVRMQTADPGDEQERLLGREILAWFDDSWVNLDPAHRASVCTGLKVLLNVFGMGPWNRMFSGKTTGPERRRGPHKPLPDLRDAVEAGSVVGLNISHNENRALGRAAGLLMKQAWLAAVLQKRTSDVQSELRPIYLICDDWLGSGLDTATEFQPDPF